MSEPTQGTSPLLLDVQTRGASLFANLVLVTAIGLAILQTMGIVDGINPDKSLVIKLIPGFSALALLVYFIILARRRGSFRIYLDRIEGKRRNGLTFNLPIDSIAEVQLWNYSAALKGTDSKLLMVTERLPGKRDGGIIWLAKAYHDFPPCIWKAFKDADSEQFEPAVRHFLGDDGEAQFGDHGFLVSAAGQTWYYPESETVDIIGLGTGQLRMNQRARTGLETRVQFSPSPDLVPISKFCGALLRANLPELDLEEILAMLAENHGGHTITRQEVADGFAGECLGYKVLVQAFPSNEG